MIEFINKLFSSNGFMPHGHCYFWKPDILWTHVLSDGLIGIAYFVIPLCLIFIAKRRNDIKYRWMLVMFSIFIYGCGATHLMSIITVWNPVYWLDGIIKAITAISSIGTAFALIKITPAAISIPTSEQWIQINEELKKQEIQLAEKEKAIERSQQALRESEQRYNTLRDIFDSVIIHQDNKIVYANRSAAHLFNMTDSKQLIGRSIIDLIHPDFAEKIKNRLQMVENGQKIPLIEQKVMRADGSEIDVESISIPFTYDGKPAVQIVIRDISERKKQERTIRESESKFRGLFESDMIGTMFWELDGKVTDANDVLLKMIGYSREDLMDGTIDWVKMTPSEFEPMEQEAYRQIASSGIHAPYEKIYIRKDGKRVPVLVGGALIKGSTNKGVSYVIDITRRKKQEKELRESEAKFRRLFELDMLGIIFSDETSIITDANDAFLNIVGYNREDLEKGGLNWSQLTAPGYEGADQKAIQALMTTGSVTPYEKEYIRKDGNYVPVLVGAAILHDTRQAVAFILDISERKKQEKIIRESESRFKRLFESNLIGIKFSDHSGKVTEANNAFLRIIGYTQEDLANDRINWLQLTPPEYVHLDKNARQMLATQTEVPPYEKEYIRKDGTRVPIIIGLAALEGQMDKTVSFMIDITEQDKARKELKQHAIELQKLNTELEESQEVLRLSEARFRKMFESDLIGIVFWDKAGNFLEINNLFLKTIGYSREDWLQGKINWIEITPPEFAQIDQDKMVELDATGIFTPFEKEYIRKDGTRVTVILGGARLEGFDDRGVSYVLDITDYKNVQRELEKRARELSQSNAELEQFAYIASHDLQEPLRTMAGFANLLEKKYKHKLDEDAVDFIEFIVDAAERMKKLITNLLEYSRITSKPSTHESVNLEDVMGKVLYQLQSKIREANAEITWEPLPTVTANPAHMNQLFNHLLSNAIKFRDSRPMVITIKAHDQPSHWLFEVTDTGIGIDMSYSTRIFQVFQRLHARDKYEGTGIGLAVCKKIVEKHGGEIWVQSAPGEGSTFFFTLQK